MHRFFVPPASIQSGQVVFLSEAAHQIYSVLRLHPGQRLVVLDNQGEEYTVELEEVCQKTAAGKIIEQQPSLGEPACRLALYLCLTQRVKFEWMLQKCTETGASTFIPVISSRSLVQDLAETNKKAGRWEKILQEAAEQSGRGRIPALKPTISLEQAVRQGQGKRIILWEQEHSTNLRQALADLTFENSPEISILVGPEGGFSIEEVQVAKQADWQPVSLGRRILRMETAAVVATALVLYELEK
ncbi:MAG: RsmE family RNA methyltransferase [Anaerolineaceae bacterium]|jgi:16S rRNA (uracil1498-N3)-methyltransferase